MLKYIYLGSPEFSKNILERLADDYGCPILVVTQPAREVGRGKIVQTTAVAEWANQSGVALLETENINSASSLQKLRSFQPDTLVVVAFGQILKEDVLSLPRLMPLNLHASLLPDYRGAAPVQWVIWNGDPETGITVQRMVKKLDAGDIVMQERLAILKDDTTESLLKRMVNPGARLLAQALAKLESGEVNLVPQDETFATLAPKMDRSHSKVDWSRPAGAIANQVRATQPWPGAVFRFAGAELKILTANAVPGEGVIGRIESDGKRFFHVQCGGGRLALLRIQAANKKPVDVGAFLSGFKGTLPSDRVDP